MRPHLTNPSSWINSCLVNRYKNGNNHIPAHRDDEAFIDPDSEIITVSIGQKRTMKFSDNKCNITKELSLANNSVLISNRFAQDFWLHGIDEDDTVDEMRYSFTFRHLSPHFVNSTVVIGDSNTRSLQFGRGLGTFGSWMPGKQIPAMHIEEIPGPLKIGPYRNIVIHTGINNIKTQNRKSNKTLVNELESKCSEILNVYPRTKIYVSLLLPTKITMLSQRVRELNNYILDMAYSHNNIRVIDHVEFHDSSNILKDDLGRFTDGRPNPIDLIHLGRKGIQMFACEIKTCIMKRRKSNNQSEHNNKHDIHKTKFAVGQVSGHRDGYQPPR